MVHLPIYSRCSMACQDSTTDAFGRLEEGSSQIPKAQAHMVKCMSGCVDSHISLLRGIQSKLEADIDKVLAGK